MSLGSGKSWKKNNEETVISADGGILGVSCIDKDIVRIRLDRTEPFRTEETFVVDPLPSSLPVEVIENSAAILIKHQSISIEIRKSPIAFSITKNGRAICSSSQSNFAAMDECRTTIRIAMTEDERIYGLGQDPMARINQRGAERWMWNEWGGWGRSGNMGVPFYSSSNGYGLLLNSSWASRFACGGGALADNPPPWSMSNAAPPWPRDANSGETNPDLLSIVLEKGIMDVFIICRNSLDEIQEGYADLTGHAPLPPKWAFGFIQCKNRYRSQEELLSIAREYRNKGIPCDAIVIDWLWFRYFGDLHWLKRDWPDPKGMMKELSDMGFKVLQAQHPFIEYGSLMYDQFKKSGFVMDVDPQGKRGAFDHSTPQARDAWWKEIRRLYEDGIRGYWTDMGELEVDRPGNAYALGPRERMHNIYTTLWAKGLHEHQKADFNTRAFSLARSGFAGTQKWGAALWSNDIDSSWEVLADQIRLGQTVALSGQQFWCTDIGGFSTDHRFSPELYIRWFQWGTFCSLFRTHGTRPFNEVWAYGGNCEKITRSFIDLRYRLLPYIYSCARQVTEKGTPIMRAMAIDFPDDPKALAAEDQFMFGPAFLVAPVSRKGQRKRTVYLPEGVWFDYWTGKKIDGRRDIGIAAPLERIPLFIRGGSIIPMEPAARMHMGDIVKGPIEIHAYPGSSAEFELYDDDGETYDYEKGNFTKNKFVMDAAGEVCIDKKGAKSAVGKQFQVIKHDGIHGVCDLPIITLDCDWASDGWVTVCATIINESYDNLKVKAGINLPPSWKIKGYTSEWLERNVRGVEVFEWSANPVSDELPLSFEAPVEFTLARNGKEEKITQVARWGSGWATRFSVAGCFDNASGDGLAKMTGVDNTPDQPSYIENGKTIPWNMNPLFAFNCYGYVDCRWHAQNDTTGPSSQGIAYAKCRVWSPEDKMVKAELLGDRSIRVMVNSITVFESPDIVFTSVKTDSFALKKGWNDVLIKVALKTDVHTWTGRELGFMFRIVDENGQVTGDLIYSP